MGKINTPLNDHKYQEEYSKSNSVDVEQSQSESTESLQPPDLIFNQTQDLKQEEEETQEVQSESSTYDIPAEEDDSNSEDNNSTINLDEPDHSSETSDPNRIFDPYGDYTSSEANDNFDSKNEASSSSSYKGINPYGEKSDSESVTSFKKKDNRVTQAFKLDETAQLKRNFEQAYGFDLSDVNIVKNSSEPAQFKAHAFARGNEIHLSPGQEQHLPHELGHVIQQKQGKVKPTASENGKAINDDPNLEKEADQMGETAMQFKSKTKSESNNLQYSTNIFNNDVSQLKASGPKKGKKQVQKTISADMIKLSRKTDMSYLEAGVEVGGVLKLSFMAEGKDADLTPDEIAVSGDGIALKKETQTFGLAKVSENMKLTSKGVFELGTKGGKAGIAITIGGHNILKDASFEFTFLDIDWKAPLTEKIKALQIALKFPPAKVPLGKFNARGKVVNVDLDIEGAVTLEPNKEKLMQKIIERYGQMATAEIAVAGGIVLVGALAIGAALHNIHMGKETKERIDNNFEAIMKYGEGFKAGLFGDFMLAGTHSTAVQGKAEGRAIREGGLSKIAKPIFEEKLKKKGKSIVQSAIMKAIPIIKQRAIENFKKAHNIEEGEYNHDFVVFMRVLDASTSSKSQYLREKLNNI